MIKVTMPKLGLTMKEGKIVKWHKREGDKVNKGEPLVEIETEKITSVVESPATGILNQIVVQDDSTVPVTETIAVIEEMEEVESDQGGSAQETAGVSPGEKIEREEAVAVERSPAKIRVSPLAQKIADKHAVDLLAIKGTGLGGTITKDDVQKLVDSREDGSPESVGPRILEIVEMNAPRRKTAEKLAQMHQETPHVTITMPVDATSVVEMRNDIKEAVEKKTGKKLTFTHIFAKAVSLALEEYREINARLAEDKIITIEDINLGIAVDVEKGLLVPVVKNSQGMNLIDIVVKISDLMEKARSGRLSLDDMTGGTFTISNLGVYDVDIFTPLLNPPECSILGIGKIFKRAWVVGDRIEARPIVTFSMTFDHRIIDGALAARFLQRVKGILEDPEDIARES
ncbi:MAG: 2-oxo acid dehydrogenase subunit E2 [Spirochaetes bacterium]|nr:2-oxo acid dehydrogenase subunit E2 [Spirochaetota bacterium]